MFKRILLFIFPFAIFAVLFYDYHDFIYLRLFNQEAKRQNIAENNRLFWKDSSRFDLRPPVPPRWVFEPWVWEDEENTQQATWDLVQGYLQRDIPVGAVIIDSPWQTNYNTFEFDRDRYPDPKKLVSDLEELGVHTILWTTSAISPLSSNYDFACKNGFFIRRENEENGCPKTWFWRTRKRVASQVDFFNPRALDWWKGLMDKAFEVGIHGWKVDMSDYHVADLGSRINTGAGVKTVRDYTDIFYRTFYDYTKEKLGAENAMISARPFCAQTVPAYWYAPKDVNPAAWVGDQSHSWEGLRLALLDIFISASAGYSAIGSDIGGYFGDYEMNAEYKRLFIRWAQMGALMPIMENGGLGEHRPWMFDEETVEIYREFAKLHQQLVPYLYSLSIEANRTGMPIVRPVEPGNEFDFSNWENDWRYLLGPDIFVAPIFEDTEQREIIFPDGKWIDYWTGEIFEGGQTILYQVPLSRYPVFVREGSGLPL